ncbi:MAG: YhdH/YhfP family quinone oxidoreductase, partial [Bdellovibrionales bacterium]|nr:YhdH/YhfP family quinone oxidoreductase [Bdellovibrionales bacterium]
MVPSSFTCFRIYKNGQKIQGRLEKTRLNELSAGEVVIKAHYSSINFKDALAASGRAKIMRHFPLIGGIDLAGELVSSESPEFEVGQKVLVTGCGLGETSDGAYSEYVRVPASWVLPLPDELSPKEAMILGTAGFTAALCLARLKANGQSPEQGPLLVTGASGGVGMIAVQILSQQSFEVVAVSSKAEHHDLLRKLGACHTLTPQQLELDTTALSSARWAGAIDNVGGQLLSQIFPHIQLWGNIACVGMAGGSQLQTSIYPLILRGV